MNIAIVTGGGDAPGLNAVIRSAVLSAVRLNWTISGLRDGIAPLVPKTTPRAAHSPQPGQRARHHLLRRNHPGHYQSGQMLSAPTRGCIPQIIENLRAHNLEALLMVGGDGTMAIAARIAKHGFPVVGIPKTIDNDLDGTVATFGFDTAVEFATQCIDRLHSTAESHGRSWWWKSWVGTPVGLPWRAAWPHR